MDDTQFHRLSNFLLCFAFQVCCDRSIKLDLHANILAFAHCKSSEINFNNFRKKIKIHSRDKLHRIEENVLSRFWGHAIPRPRYLWSWFKNQIEIRFRSDFIFINETIINMFWLTSYTTNEYEKGIARSDHSYAASPLQTDIQKRQKTRRWQ